MYQKTRTGIAGVESKYQRGVGGGGVQVSKGVSMRDREAGGKPAKKDLRISATFSGSTQ